MAGSNSGIKKYLWDKPVLGLLIFLLILIVGVATGFFTIAQAGMSLAFVFQMLWYGLKILGSILKEAIKHRHQ